MSTHMIVRILSAVSILAAASAPAAAAVKNCEDLKTQIEERLKSKKVATYTLEVVDAGKKAEGEEKAGGKVVGTCERGTKKIVYSKK